MAAQATITLLVLLAAGAVSGRSLATRTLLEDAPIIVPNTTGVEMAGFVFGSEVGGEQAAATHCMPAIRCHQMSRRRGLPQHAPAICR